MVANSDAQPAQCVHDGDFHYGQWTRRSGAIAIDGLRELRLVQRLLRAARMETVARPSRTMEWRVCPFHGTVAVPSSTLQCTRCDAPTVDLLDRECDQLIQQLSDRPAVAPVDWRAWFASTVSLIVALLCTAMIAAVLIGRMP